MFFSKKTRNLQRKRLRNLKNKQATHMELPAC